jgi:hypothetical protein
MASTDQTPYLDDQLFLTKNALRRYQAAFADANPTASDALRSVRFTGTLLSERPIYVPNMKEPTGYITCEHGCFPVVQRHGMARSLVAVSFFAKTTSPQNMTGDQLADQVHITRHALERYCERYSGTSFQDAVRELPAKIRSAGVARTAPPWVLGFDREQLFIVVDNEIALPLVRSTEPKATERREWAATTCITASLLHYDFAAMTGEQLADHIALTRHCTARYQERGNSMATLTHDLIQEVLGRIRVSGRWTATPPTWTREEKPASGGYCVFDGDVCLTLVRADLSHANGRGAHNRPLIAVTCRTPGSEQQRDSGAMPLAQAA